MTEAIKRRAVAVVPSFHHEHPSYRWWVLGNVLITTFMSVIEATIVNTALPKMQTSFGTSLDLIKWVLTAYQIVFAVVLPLSGWLADKIGYKRTFFLALFIFTLGSLLCSFAWNERVLIAFRVLQGIGGGMIMPVGMAVVTREFPPKERGMAMGFYGIAAAAAVSIGPSLGGYLVDTFGWASVFLVNVPLGCLALVATVVIQREFRKPDVGAFDFPGFASVTIFLVSLLLALSDGNSDWNIGGWTSFYILTNFTIAAVSLVAFFAIELTARHPLIDLSLFKNRNFALSSLLLFLIGFVLMGTTFLFPLYLQGTLGYTALQSGLLFLPLGLIQGVVSPITGVLADRTNRKALGVIGMAVLVVSFYLNTQLTENPPFWMIMLPICMRGVGFGIFFIVIQAVSINSLPHDKMAQGAGLITLTRQIGASFGVAVFGAILNQRNAFHLAMAGEAMDSWSEPFRIAAGQLKYAYANGGVSGAAANSLTPALFVKEATVRAFVQSLDDSFWIVCGMILVCLVPMLLLRTKLAAKAGKE